MLHPIFKTGTLKQSILISLTCQALLWCATPPSLLLSSMCLSHRWSPSFWLGPRAWLFSYLYVRLPSEMEQGCAYRLDQSLPVLSRRMSNFLKLEGLLPLRSDVKEDPSLLMCP